MALAAVAENTHSIERATDIDSLLATPVSEINPDALRDLPENIIKQVEAAVAAGDRAAELESIPLVKRLYENYKVEEDRADIPVAVVVDRIDAKIKERLESGRGVSDDEKTLLTNIQTDVKEWVGRLENREADPETADILKELPENVAEELLRIHKEQVMATLQVVDKLLEPDDGATFHTKVILERMIASKTREERPEDVAEFKQKLEGKLKPERIDELTNELATVRKLGPLPMRQFIGQFEKTIPETLVADNTLTEYANFPNLKEQLNALEKQTDTAFEKLVEIIDETTWSKTETVPKWRRDYNTKNSTWEALAQAVKVPEGVLDATSGDNLWEKTGTWFWKKEGYHQTKQSILNINEKAIKETKNTEGVTVRKEVDVQRVHITIRQEEKLRNTPGVAYAKEDNPWMTKTLFSANYRSLEECVEGIEQLRAADVVNSIDGKPFAKPIIKTPDGRVFDANNTEITTRVKYGVTILQRGEPKRLVVDAKTYIGWKTALQTAETKWREQGFEYDPKEHMRKNTVESPSDKIDMIRQRNTINQIYTDSRESFGDAWDEQTDGRLLERGMEMFRTFADNYGNTERYKQIAEQRVRNNYGYGEGSLEWHQTLFTEVNNVTFEMHMAESVLRNVATEIFNHRNFPNLLMNDLRNMEIRVIAELSAKIEVCSSRFGVLDAKAHVFDIMRNFGLNITAAEYEEVANEAYTLKEQVLRENAVATAEEPAGEAAETLKPYPEDGLPIEPEQYIERMRLLAQINAELDPTLSKDARIAAADALLKERVPEPGPRELRKYYKKEDEISRKELDDGTYYIFYREIEHENEYAIFFIDDAREREKQLKPFHTEARRNILAGFADIEGEAERQRAINEVIRLLAETNERDLTPPEKTLMTKFGKFKQGEEVSEIEKVLGIVDDSDDKVVNDGKAIVLMAKSTTPEEEDIIESDAENVEQNRMVSYRTKITRPQKQEEDLEGGVNIPPIMRTGETPKETTEVLQDVEDSDNTNKEKSKREERFEKSFTNENRLRLIYEIQEKYKQQTEKN